jgi:hypothetical protein
MKYCNSHPSGPEPAGFVSLVHTEVMNYETVDYLCPNWIEGHKTCAKHRMWIKDKVCLACQLRSKK